MIERLINNFSKIPLGQRLVLMVAVAATVATVFVIVLWAQKPDFQPLFTDLSSQDASAIVDRLQASHTPYQLAAGGTAVMVPAERVHELRLKMAEEGIPAGGGVGFEIFDRSNYGTTDYVQKVNYRRALEGEMARTIRAMDAVSSARVHLVLPEKRLFSKDQEAARASVVLKLKGRSQLSPEQVAAVVHLVGSAVEGLAPERVTVVDVSGRVLYAGNDKADDAQLAQSHAGYRFQLEEQIRDRVAGILAPALGVDRVQVQVAADVDFTHKETTEEFFDPDKPSVRSEHHVKEQSEGRSGAGGVAGMTAQNSLSDTSSSKHQDETINYELNKTISHTVDPVGSLKRLSVAVLVDGVYAPDAKGKMVYSARGGDEMAKYVALVKKAMGFNADRGDSVEVVNIPFAEPAMPQEAEAAPTAMEKLQPYMGVTARYGVALVGIALVVFLVLRPLVRMVSSPPSRGNTGGELILSEGLPKTVGQLEMEAGRLFENFKSDAVLPSSPEEVIRMAQANPRQTAQMLKSWMREG